jgi:hypothetical protein
VSQALDAVIATTAVDKKQRLTVAHERIVKGGDIVGETLVMPLDGQPDPGADLCVLNTSSAHFDFFRQNMVLG